MIKLIHEGTNHAYHDGDLRHALIDAALAYIKEGNADFTIGGVARRVGVNHAAPLKDYFPGMNPEMFF